VRQHRRRTPGQARCRQLVWIVCQPTLRLVEQAVHLIHRPCVSACGGHEDQPRPGDGGQAERLSEIHGA
jgi:hypothetical protein